MINKIKSSIIDYFCKEKSSITQPTYNDIHNACIAITKQIKAADIEFDYIIGLVRGGMIPAVIISHALDDTPMVAIHYSSKAGAGDNKNHENDLPDFPPLSKILIVDDICDSGYTLSEVFGHYTLQKHFVQTAVLHNKENVMHKPDYIWINIKKDSPWIIYPFEEEGGNQ